MSDQTAATPLPVSIQIDAWPGNPATGALSDSAPNWGARRGLPPSQEPLAFDPPVDPSRWDHEAVGYGILLRDTLDEEWSESKATGATAPAAIRELLKARPATVLLYWNPRLSNVHLRRYYNDGTTSDLLVGLSEFGVMKNHLPRYVLIVGDPHTIPWSVQFSLSIRHAVGRLPFDGDDLEPYISAMLDGENGWAASPTDDDAAVVWAVDHGSSDITRLMRSVLAAPLVAKYSGTLPGLIALSDNAATGRELIKALEAKPIVVVTSSHGATPLESVELRRVLGLPVDVDRATILLADLEQAIPGGAVWFAQACCSAGSSNESSFASLLSEGSTARSVVETVAKLGSIVSPAPAALLAREKPVRAIFGHVEPTFDWTLKDVTNNQRLSGDIVSALSTNLYFGQPLGLILASYYGAVGSLLSRWSHLVNRLDTTHDQSVLTEMTNVRLTAWDRMSLVLLGDPTVRIPPLR